MTIHFILFLFRLLWHKCHPIRTAINIIQWLVTFEISWKIISFHSFLLQIIAVLTFWLWQMMWMTHRFLVLYKQHLRYLKWADEWLTTMRICESVIIFLFIGVSYSLFQCFRSVKPHETKLRCWMKLFYFRFLTDSVPNELILFFENSLWTNVRISWEKFGSNICQKKDVKQIKINIWIV